MARKGEGEPKRQLLILDAQLVHEVGQAFSYVVKELQNRADNTSDVRALCMCLKELLWQSLKSVGEFWTKHLRLQYCSPSGVSSKSPLASTLPAPCLL